MAQKKNHEPEETPLRKQIKKEKEDVCRSLGLPLTQENLDKVILHTYWERYQ